MHVLHLGETQRSPFPPPLNAIWLISFANELQIIKIFFSFSSLVPSPSVQPVGEKKGSMRAERKCLKIVVYDGGTPRCIRMCFARSSFRGVDCSDRVEERNASAPALGRAANYGPVWNKRNRSHTSVSMLFFFFFILTLQKLKHTASSSFFFSWKQNAAWLFGKKNQMGSHWRSLEKLIKMKPRL